MFCMCLIKSIAKRKNNNNSNCYSNNKSCLHSFLLNTPHRRRAFLSTREENKNQLLECFGYSVDDAAEKVINPTDNRQTKQSVYLSFFFLFCFFTYCKWLQLGGSFVRSLLVAEYVFCSLNVRSFHLLHLLG